MQEIKQYITINRPARYAFDFTLNPKNTPKWVTNITLEQKNEVIPKLGTIYKNQWQDGRWKHFEITNFQAGTMFEMTEKGSDVHVSYIFTPVGENQCQLEYTVRATGDQLIKTFSEENIRQVLQKLKEIIEV